MIADTTGAFKTSFDTFNLRRPTLREGVAAAGEGAPGGRIRREDAPLGMGNPGRGGSGLYNGKGGRGCDCRDTRGCDWRGALSGCSEDPDPELRGDRGCMVALGLRGELPVQLRRSGDLRVAAVLVGELHDLVVATQDGFQSNV